MNPPLQTAAQRFWRGVREPWDLLARMRAHPPLWRRYWRVVIVQVAVTLVAGAVVFWVGKRGAEEWRDAFGADAPLAEVAPVTSSAPATLAGHDPEPSPTAKAPASPVTSPVTAEKRSQSVRSAVRDALKKAKLKTNDAKGDDEDQDEEEADDDPAGEENTNSSEAAVEKEIEAAVEEISKAKRGERGKVASESVARAIARVKEASSKASRRAERAKKEGTTPKDPEQARQEELAEQTEDLNDSVEALGLGAHALATDPPSDYRKAHRARLKLEDQIGEEEAAVKKLQALGGPGLTEAQQTQLRTARADLLTAREHEHNLAGRLGALLGFLAVIYASLSIAQAGVLAMSRDFHDALSRELSLLVLVAPEDPPIKPRIRLDVPWVRRKTNRRVQFFLGFLPGTALIWLVGRLIPGPVREYLVPALTTVWAAYWWMVMTAGQSARAWTPPETTSPPWYIRGWQTLTTKVFLFRWGVPRAWGRLWERMSKRFYGPAERVEEQPMEFAGLALSRAVALFPLTKLLVRPLFPVAAARLLVEHAATARLAVPVTADELVLAAARSPDPEAREHSGAWARPSLPSDGLRGGS